MVNERDETGTSELEPFQDTSPEQVNTDDALARMKRFAERREKFIAAIKTGPDRDLSSHEE